MDAWLLTPGRVAIYRSARVAVVADLHLGYAEARRRGGDSVPCRSCAEVLAPLLRELHRHGVSKLVIAGDLFEAGYSAQLAVALQDWLHEHRLQLLAVVPGNHDRGWQRGRDGLPFHEAGFVIDDWVVVHGEGVVQAGKHVQGHWHPGLRWGRTPLLPCYLRNAETLILPAYCRESAGVDVRWRRDWGAYRCHVIVGEDVLDVGPVGRLRDRLGERTAREPPRG